jgi:CRP-like cAMP-binding protein
VIVTEARLAFLRRIHLFRDLDDEALTVIAGMLKEESHKEGEVIFSQGSDADRFYIIYQGKVNITRIHRKEEQELAALIGGDYFGEEELLSNGKRSATISTIEQTYLFMLDRVEFKAIIKKYPKLKAAFEVSAASRKLARDLHFNWLRPEEVIYFVARKHEVLLFQALTGPVVALSVPVLLFVYFFLTRSFFAIFGAGVLLVADGGWALWNWIDWGNDYYIVTNERVIWLEKVIGIYDSRQEAPLSTVLSVGVETDVSGRLLDYGHVIVRTYVGKIPFHHVSHPYEAAHMVEEQWTRTKHSASRMEKEAMRNVLRQKMGLTVETQSDQPPQLDVKASPTFYRRSILKMIGANWFKLRQENGGTVTYRKHLYVLWQQVWQPTLLIILLALGILARLVTLVRTPGESLFNFTNGFKVDTVVIALPIVMIPLVVWWIYQYIDWSNDIFQVTPDQILDIDRKPFGSEERRAAPLENILSTQAHRYGLAGYFLNFGTVEITVGGTHLDFVDVLDPVGVQADIDRRREARIKQKRDVEANAERERMSDWLVAYYENEPELRQRDAAPETKPKSE